MGPSQDENAVNLLKFLLIWPLRIAQVACYGFTALPQCRKTVIDSITVIQYDTVKR